MADAAEPTADPSTSDAAPVRGSAPIMRIIMAVGFIVVVVGVECIVALMIFPSVDEVAALAQAKQADDGDALPGDADELAGGNRVEVDLGEFAVSAYQPLSNTTLRIDFHLFGTVETGEEDDLLEEIEKNKHRFREQVLVIMRSAELADLSDAGLGLIKRKILEKSNRVFGKTLLREVVFSDFSFIEQ